jgi:hypothetical protein
MHILYRLFLYQNSIPPHMGNSLKQPQYVVVWGTSGSNSHYSSLVPNTIRLRFLVFEPTMTYGILDPKLGLMILQTEKTGVKP